MKPTLFAEEEEILHNFAAIPGLRNDLKFDDFLLQQHGLALSSSIQLICSGHFKVCDFQEIGPADFSREAKMAIFNL